MSDGIRELSNSQRSAMTALQRRNKHELEQTNRIHNLNIAEVKKSHSNEMHVTRENHLLDLAAEVQKKEETLQALRQSQEQTQKITEAETKRQQIHAAHKRDDFRQKAEADIAKTNEIQVETLEDLNLKFNSNLKDLHERGQDQVAMQEHQQRSRLNNEGERWRHNIDQQRGKFNETFTVEGDKYTRMLDNQKKLNENQTLNVHRGHEAKMTKMNTEHVKQEEQVKNLQQKALTDKEVFFEKKFKDQWARHEESHKHLDGLNQKILDTAKDKLTKRIEVEKNRSNDAFFNFTEMRPKLEERPDSYVLRMEVPDYAKEEVTLTANSKELVLTSSRRYQDERKDVDGTQKKVSKVESMVSRIPVGQVLDPRKMEKHYADGMLTFIVKKA